MKHAIIKHIPKPVYVNAINKPNLHQTIGRNINEIHKHIINTIHVKIN